MKCRRCKYLIKEGDLEYLMIHLWETHGRRLSNLKETYPEANWDYVAELQAMQKRTGQAGSEEKFGKKSTRVIKVKPI